MPTVTVTVSRRGDVDPVAELSALVEGLDELPGAIVTEAAPAAREAILGSVAAQRGSLSMSRAGGSLDVAVTVNTGARSGEAILLGEPRHLWRFAQGTREHVIEVAYPRAMATPWGPKSRVEHPGTPTVDLVTPATEAADAAVDEIVDRLADEVIA